MQPRRSARQMDPAESRRKESPREAAARRRTAHGRTRHKRRHQARHRMRGHTRAPGARRGGGAAVGCVQRAGWPVACGVARLRACALACVTLGPDGVAGTSTCPARGDHAGAPAASPEPCAGAPRPHGSAEAGRLAVGPALRYGVHSILHHVVHSMLRCVMHSIVLGIVRSVVHSMLHRIMHHMVHRITQCTLHGAPGRLASAGMRRGGRRGPRHSRAAALRRAGLRGLLLLLPLLLLLRRRLLLLPLL